MADLSLDLNPTSATYRDLLFVDNNLVLTSDADPAGTDPVLQDCLTRMSSFLYEWFLDQTFGVGWFQQILVKGAKQSTIDSILINVILGTNGIVMLNSYSFNPDPATRSCAVSFRAQKSTGTINYSGTIQAAGG